MTTLPAPPAVADPAPPPVMAPEPANRSRSRTYVIVGAAVLLVAIAIAVVRSGGSSTQGESFDSPPQTFAALPSTPEAVHDALLAKAFVTADLPPGFTVDPRKSPGGRLSKAQGFSSVEEDKQHNLVGTAVLSVTNPALPGVVFQLTFMSFAEPGSANAYVQEVRGTPATGPEQLVGDQQVCGVFPPGTLIACSSSHENVVVAGVARSATADPIPATDGDAVLDSVNKLAQAGIARLIEAKGG
ncbi:MAG: hypothetical protein QOG87_3384 [Actinomycetota bacterium]|jgi:hypothetical protein